MVVIVLMIALFFCFVIFVSILFAGRLDLLMNNQRTISNNQVTINKAIDSLKFKE